MKGDLIKFSLQVIFRCRLLMSTTYFKTYMKGDLIKFSLQVIFRCSTTYVIVPLFSRLFNECFEFLKNCPYNFHKILHNHSTPKDAPACAMASKLHKRDLRNLAKISQKMANKQAFLDNLDFLENYAIG